MSLRKAFSHFKTITHHRHLVMKGCFKAGLYWQGLTHDLSKYSWVEFSVGARYFQGDRSPNNAEREATGVSLAWLHHKGRNKHHLEYWIDYNVNRDPSSGKDHGAMAGMKMPERYVVEMFVDRISASKNYLKESYRDDAPLQYFLKSQDHYIIHPQTKELLHQLLLMNAQKGEDETFRYIRKEILHNL
ncbi:MAG: catalase [Lachnospiraceae bacterium]|nr:catalase [Lachnospiraceae bacterium]